jgi:hypothetical protein
LNIKNHHLRQFDFIARVGLYGINALQIMKISKLSFVEEKRFALTPQTNWVDLYEMFDRLDVGPKEFISICGRWNKKYALMNAYLCPVNKLQGLMGQRENLSDLLIAVGNDRFFQSMRFLSDFELLYFFFCYKHLAYSKDLISTNFSITSIPIPGQDLGGPVDKGFAFKHTRYFLNEKPNDDSYFLMTEGTRPYVLSTVFSGGFSNQQLT